LFRFCRRSFRDRVQTFRQFGAQQSLKTPFRSRQVRVVERVVVYEVERLQSQHGALHCPSTSAKMPCTNEEEAGRRTAANLMTKDEARRIALNIAKLPTLKG
jgi:hypothetical protein